MAHDAGGILWFLEGCSVLACFSSQLVPVGHSKAWRAGFYVGIWELMRRRGWQEGSFLGLVLFMWRLLRYEARMMN